MLRSLLVLLACSMFSPSVFADASGFDMEGGKNYCDSMFNIRMQQHFQRGDVVLSSSKQRYLRLCYGQFGLVRTSSLQMASLTGNSNIDQFRGMCEIEAEMIVHSRQSRGLPITSNFVERYTNRCFDKMKSTFGADAEVIENMQQESATIEI